MPYQESAIFYEQTNLSINTFSSTLSKRNFTYYHQKQQHEPPTSPSSITPSITPSSMRRQRLAQTSPPLTPIEQDLQALLPQEMHFQPYHAVSLLCTPNEKHFCEQVVKGLNSKQIPSSLHLVNNLKECCKIPQTRVLFILSHEIQSVIPPFFIAPSAGIRMQPVNSYLKKTQHKKDLWHSILTLWTPSH